MNFTTTLTNAGRALNAELIVSEQPLAINGIQIGDGFVPDGTDPRDMADLASSVHTVSSLRKYVMTDTVSVFEFDYGSSTVTQDGMWLREIGIFATRPDGEVILHSYFNAGEFADFIPASGGASYLQRVIRLLVEVSDAETIIFEVIEEAATVKARNIGTKAAGAGAYAGKGSDGTLTFKRFAGGEGINVTETGSVITIGAPKLEKDIDIYVPLTHPDVSDDDVAFDTIQEAFDYLSRFTIPSNLKATINVGPGTFDISESILVDHAQGNRIRLVGYEAGSFAPASAIAANATARTITLTVPNLSSLPIAVGDYVGSHGNDWGSAWQGLGMFRVTNISGNALTLHNSSRHPANITSTSNANSRCYYWQTKLHTSTDINLLNINGGGLGLIHGICFRGVGTDPTSQAQRGRAIHCEGSEVFIEACGIDNFATGINADHGNIRGALVFISECNFGIDAVFSSRVFFQDGPLIIVGSPNSPQAIRLWECTIGQFGSLHPRIAGFLVIHGCFRGVSVTGMSKVTFFGSIIQDNGNYGVHLGSMSLLNFGSNPDHPRRSAIINNRRQDAAAGDLEARGSSTAIGPISGGAASGGQIGNCIPAQRTLGNSNSWIDLSA